MKRLLLSTILSIASLVALAQSADIDVTTSIPFVSSVDCGYRGGVNCAFLLNGDFTIGFGAGLHYANVSYSTNSSMYNKSNNCLLPLFIRMQITSQNGGANKELKIMGLCDLGYSISLSSKANATINYCGLFCEPRGGVIFKNNITLSIGAHIQWIDSVNSNSYQFGSRMNPSLMIHLGYHW